MFRLEQPYKHSASSWSGATMKTLLKYTLGPLAARVQVYKVFYIVDAM